MCGGRRESGGKGRRGRRTFGFGAYAVHGQNAATIFGVIDRRMALAFSFR